MTMITTTADLAAACKRLAQFDVVTVDTEFMRETTYWPKLCVIQMASPEEAVIVDALAPDISPRSILQADGEREGHEGLSCRAAGHRNRLPPRRPDPAPGLRHPGRRHGLRLRRFDQL